MQFIRRSILLILKQIKHEWNNIKNAPSINQKRYDLEGFKKIPKDEVQNKCKRNCACKKKEIYLKKRC